MGTASSVRTDRENLTITENRFPLAALQSLRFLILKEVFIAVTINLNHVKLGCSFRIVGVIIEIMVST